MRAFKRYRFHQKRIYIKNVMGKSSCFFVISDVSAAFLVGLCQMGYKGTSWEAPFFMLRKLWANQVGRTIYKERNSAVTEGGF